METTTETIERTKLNSTQLNWKKGKNDEQEKNYLHTLMLNEDGNQIKWNGIKWKWSLQWKWEEKEKWINE